MHIKSTISLMHLKYVIRNSYIICTYISIVFTTTLYSYVATYYTIR